MAREKVRMYGCNPFLQVIKRRKPGKVGGVHVRSVKLGTPGLANTNTGMKSHRQALVVSAAIIALLVESLSGAVERHPLDVYSYVSPAAAAVLKSDGIDVSEIEQFVRRAIKSRSIVAVDDGRLFAGSQDALRIDIRENNAGLIVELSVRQGVSIAYMLERWEGHRLVSINTLPQLRGRLLEALSMLISQLATAYGTTEYNRGRMIGG